MRTICFTACPPPPHGLGHWGSKAMVFDCMLCDPRTHTHSTRDYTWPTARRNAAGWKIAPRMCPTCSKFWVTTRFFSAGRRWTETDNLSAVSIRGAQLSDVFCLNELVLSLHLLALAFAFAAKWSNIGTENQKGQPLIWCILQARSQNTARVHTRTRMDTATQFFALWSKGSADRCCSFVPARSRGGQCPLSTFASTVLLSHPLVSAQLWAEPQRWRRTFACMLPTRLRLGCLRPEMRNRFARYGEHCAHSDSSRAQVSRFQGNQRTRPHKPSFGCHLLAILWKLSLHCSLQQHVFSTLTAAINTASVA